MGVSYSLFIIRRVIPLKMFTYAFLWCLQPADEEDDTNSICDFVVEDDGIIAEEYVETVKYHTGSARLGWGLRTVNGASGPNILVGEYKGERITFHEMQQRQRLRNEEDRNESYIYELQPRTTYIDASDHGNDMRFINHSCNPNCYAMPCYIDGIETVGIFTKRKISSGEPLTLDYGTDFFTSKMRCECGHCSDSKLFL